MIKKKSAIINFCFALREGGNNHVRSKSFILLQPHCSLCPNETDLNTIQSILFEWSFLLHTWEMSKEHVEASQPTNILIDWSFSYWFRLKHLSYLTAICHFLWFNSRKWLFTLICCGLDHHVCAAWLNKVALMEHVDCIAVSENHIYKLNIRPAINVCFCAFK